MATGAEIAAKYGVTFDEEEEQGPVTAESIAAKYLEDEPEYKPAPVAGEEPGVLTRAKDKVQLGISDFFSTMAGDTYGRGTDDPTEKTPVSLPFRPVAAAANVVRGVGGGAAEIIGAGDEAVGSPLAKTMAYMEENRAQHPIYSQSGIEQAVKDIEEWSPEYAPAIKDVATVGSAVAPYVKPLSALTKYTGGKRRVDALPDQKEAIRRADIERRWRPEGEEVLQKGNTVDESGLMKTRKYSPNEFRRQMYDDIQELDLDPRESRLSSFKKIDDAVENMRIDLDDSLKFEDYMPIRNVENSIRENLESVYDLPSMSTKNPRKAAQAVMKEWKKVLKSHEVDGEIKPGALLQARRELDQWINGQDPKLLNAETAGGQAAAIRAIREAINAEVARAVPKADVLESLRKQSSLLTARDQQRGFAAGEAGNRFTRALARTQQDTGLVMPHSPAAVGANLQAGPLLLGTGMLAATSLGRGAKGLGRYTGAGLSRTLQEIYNPTRGALPAAALYEDEEDAQKP